MNIVIIDDESKARSLLRTIIEDGDDFVSSILEASNLADGVDLIQENNPQLVFLDIEMPNQQGIEIFNYFDKETIDFEIVFTTAYDQYALQAFEMNAIDYILKPLRPKRILEVIEKVRSMRHIDNLNVKFEELRNSLKTGVFKKIGLPVNDGVLFLPLEEIIHMEAEGMYTNFYTVNSGTILVSKPLKYFTHVLETDYGFYRPHRSHIFNMKFLKKYVRKDGNYVILENDHIIPITKDKREEFLRLIEIH